MPFHCKLSMILIRGKLCWVGWIRGELKVCCYHGTATNNYEKCITLTRTMLQIKKTFDVMSTVYYAFKIGKGYLMEKCEDYKNTQQTFRC